MTSPSSGDLADAQWAILDLLIPEPPGCSDGRGRPWRDRREVLDGILWVWRTGTRWKHPRERYPRYQTCQRGFQQWVRSRVVRGLLEGLALELKYGDRLDVREAFSHAMFAPAKKGAPLVA